MSTKVELFFVEIDVPELRNLIKGYKMIRLMGRVMFKSKVWLESTIAIVDTGAHISVIPKSIWQDTNYEIKGKYLLKGIIPRKECELEVLVGEIVCKLVDTKRNYTEDLKVNAYLVPTDEIPLIIGFYNLLDKYKICFEYRNNKAYLGEI